MATNQRYRTAFLDCVASCIAIMYNFGADFLFVDNGKIGLERLPIMLQSKVKTSILGVGKFLGLNIIIV